MTDPVQTTQTTPTTASTTTPVVAPATTTPATTTPAAQSAVVVDKNKTPEQYIKEAELKYIVPPLVREKFTDLIKLIYETESMNQEEREYWLQIMPIMSEDQIKKFRDILVNERDQLLKLDNEYQQEMAKINQPAPAAPAIDEEKMKEAMAEIKQAEVASEQAEKSEEEQLLKQMDSL